MSDTISDHLNDSVAIIDFLNLTRKYISDRKDAKFSSVNDFIEKIIETVKHIRTFGNFKKIYLITKSFRFDDEISYYDVVRIIMWSVCKAVPEWFNKFCLVLVNGINDKDKEADDRALFIMFNEILKTKMNPIIISNDNFESLRSHYLRQVTLNFYLPIDITDSWKNMKIISSYNAIFRQNNNITTDQYTIIQPCNHQKNYIYVTK